MHCLAYWLVGIAQLAQPVEPPAKPVAPAAAAAPAPDEPETDFDRLVKNAADRIDAIETVSARLRQSIKAGERRIDATGVYMKGPGYRGRFELDIDLADAIGKRIHLSDGKMGYRFEQILEAKDLKSFRMDEIMPLIERKEIPPEVRAQYLMQFPFLRPGDMLRGYLRSVTFTKKEEGTLGEGSKRDVIVVEGQWRRKYLPLLAGGHPGAAVPADVEGLPGRLPQYVRLHLDKKTGWPLRVELFRRDSDAEWVPIYVLEFLEVEFPKMIPAEEFRRKWDMEAQDLTVEIVAQLKALKDKPESSAAGKAGSGREGAEPARAKSAGSPQTDSKVKPPPPPPPIK